MAEDDDLEAPPEASLEEPLLEPQLELLEESLEESLEEPLEVPVKATLEVWTEYSTAIANQFAEIATVLREESECSSVKKVCAQNGSASLTAKGTQEAADADFEAAGFESQAQRDLVNLRIECRRREAELEKLRRRARTAVENKDAAESRLGDLRAERDALRARADQLIERAAEKNGLNKALRAVVSDSLLKTMVSDSGESVTSTDEATISGSVLGSASIPANTPPAFQPPGYLMSSVEYADSNAADDVSAMVANSVSGTLPRKVRFDDRLQESPRVLKEPAPPESASQLARSKSPILKRKPLGSFPVSGTTPSSSAALATATISSTSPVTATTSAHSPLLPAIAALRSEVESASVAVGADPGRYRAELVGAVHRHLATVMVPLDASPRTQPHQISQVAVPHVQTMGLTNVQGLTVKQN